MPKQKPPVKILAIDPGTRYWGIAIFEGRKIKISMVKVLTANHSPANRLKEAREVFYSLLEDYSPNVFVLEKPFFFWSKQAHFLDTLVDEIKDMARKKRISFHEYSPRTVRKVVCGNGNASKKDMAKFLTLIYPELVFRFNQGKRYKDLYWGHMFDAVGLGLCYLRQQEVDGN